MRFAGDRLCGGGQTFGLPSQTGEGQKGANGHLFPRWDEPGGERFNLEATNQGLGCFPDDYYRTGMYQIDPEIERRASLLQSLTPREELAAFLENRGYRWLEVGTYQPAVEAFAWASAIAPQIEIYLCAVADLMDRWRDALNVLKPPAFPAIYTALEERRFPETLPLDVEQRLLSLEAIEFILANESHRRTWLDALRKGLPANVPTAVVVDYSLRGGWRMQFKYAKKASAGGTMHEDSLPQGQSSPVALNAAGAALNRFCFSITVGAKDFGVYPQHWALDRRSPEWIRGGTRTSIGR